MSAATSRCSSAALIRLCATTSPTARPHYDAVVARLGDPGQLDRYRTVFIDSITVAGRLCFQWAKGQPEAFSDKTGKPDIRGAYGLHGREMIAWLTHLQHTRSKNIWFVGILDEKLDDFNRKVLCRRSKRQTGLELPGIVDEVISMVELKDDEAPPTAPSSARRSTPSAFRQGPLRGR